MTSSCKCPIVFVTNSRTMIELFHTLLCKGKFPELLLTMHIYNKNDKESTLTLYHSLEIPSLISEALFFFWAIWKKDKCPSFSAHLLAISTLSRSGRKHVNTSSNTGRHIYQWQRSQTRKRGYKWSSFDYLNNIIFQTKKKKKLSCV